LSSSKLFLAVSTEKTRPQKKRLIKLDGGASLVETVPDKPE
jgi:hypothetical protein